MPTIFASNPTHSYTQLMSLIRQTRTQMIHSAITNGFTSPETVQLSQKLDQYLNQEQKQRSKAVNI